MRPDPLDDVLSDARAFGFLGPGPIEDQRRHAEAFLAAIDGPVGVAVDLGSGGGVPGLVLARLLPGSRWVLVDAMARRTAFLDDAVARLGLADRVTVRTARAEDAGRDATLRGQADVVVARGFGPPPVTAECAAPFLRVGGALVVSEPPASEGQRWAESGLDVLGLRLEATLVGPPAFVRLRQVAVCPTLYPRRSGVPRKRPLWT